METTTYPERVVHEWRFLEQIVLDLDNGTKWEMVRRKWWQKAVAGVIRNTDTGNIVLINQYQHPLGQRTIQSVAGLTDKVWLSLQEVMAEEVREESWYQQVDSIEFLGEVASSPGMTNETTLLYSIEVSGERWEQNLEADEDIRVMEIPEAELREMIRKKSLEWQLIDPKIGHVMYMISDRTSQTLSK